MDSSEEGGEKELPDDVVVEIFARLPGKSLLRFRSVSKHWYSLIFTLHTARERRRPLFYFIPATEIIAPPKTTVSFGFGDVTERLTFWGYYIIVNIVGCSNGVVCLSLWPHSLKYVFWNPATRQVREIGNPPLASPLPLFKFSSGFCLDPVTNYIKVVHIRLSATEEGENKAQVIVFSSATNSWTEKENMTVPSPIWLSGYLTRIIDTTCVDGYMFWHIAIDRPTTSSEVEDMFILSYDMNGEVFNRIEIPFRPDRFVHHLAAYGGSLAVFVGERTGSNVDVWVLNDCSGANQSWSKLLSCRPPLKAASFVGFFRKDNVDLILFRKDPDWSLHLYDPENGETKEFRKRPYGMHTFLYSEGLASLDLPGSAE